MVVVSHDREFLDQGLETKDTQTQEPQKPYIRAQGT